MSKKRATGSAKELGKYAKNSGKPKAPKGTGNGFGPLGIIKPSSGSIPVSGQHYICAEGSYPGSNLSRIFGKIVDVAHEPGSTPEWPCTEGAVIDFYGSNWWFHGDQLISGANCSGQAPLPGNKLALWGSLTDGSYVQDAVVFSGSCAGSTQCDQTPGQPQTVPATEDWPERLVAVVSQKRGDFEDMSDELEFRWDAARQRWVAYDPSPDRGHYTLYLSQCGPASGYLLANPVLHPALVSPTPESHYSPLHLIFDIAGTNRLGTRGGCTLTIVDPNAR